MLNKENFKNFLASKVLPGNLKEILVNNSENLDQILAKSFSVIYVLHREKFGGKVEENEMGQLDLFSYEFQLRLNNSRLDLENSLVEIAQYFRHKYPHLKLETLEQVELFLARHLVNRLEETP